MIAIIIRRESLLKLFLEWEEMAVTSAIIQNVHIQASESFSQLACYWSS